MPAPDPLIDFLRQQKHHTEHEQVSWAEIREAWIKDLHDLMSQFKEWLQDAVAEHLLTVEESEVLLSENNLGTYSAPALTICAPRSRSVHIVPKARVVLGSEGRVDFESGPNRAKLLRVAGDWKFVREDFSGSPLGPLAAPMKRELADLNEQNFRETIRELLA